MKVEDMAKELGISISHSYKIMQQLNKELKAKGYMTIAGRVNRKYFMEKFCYLKQLYDVGMNERMFLVTKSSLHREMARGAKEAGVQRIRIHDIRHSHVSHAHHGGPVI